MFTNTHY